MATKQNGSVMVVLAHPDDEAFAVGGTLAALSAGGTNVTLICATRGDVGEISDPSLATAETLATVRETELRCSCAALGIDPPIFLGYRDSGMAGAETNSHPDSLAAADLSEVTGRVVRCVRELRPGVLISFDAGGGYGHPDHIAVHKATSEAFHKAGDPSCYPEQLGTLQPHTPRKLLYTAIPRSLFRGMIDRMREMALDASVFASWPDPETVGTPDEEIDLVVDIAPYVDTKRKAIDCHATQVAPDNPFNLLPQEEIRAFLSVEHFIQAVPKPGEKIEGSAHTVILG